MWDLDFSKLQGNNCHDGILNLLVSYLGYNINSFYMSRFFTSYFVEGQETLTDSIDFFKSLIDHENLIQRYLGIKYKRYNNIKNIQEFINNNIALSPIGIWLDAYYCKWTPMYNKTHFNHYILLVDIDYDKMQYVCVDIYYSKVGFIFIDFNQMSDLANAFDCYEFSFQEKITASTYLEYIRNYFFSININDIYAEKGLFQKFISTAFHINKENVKVSDVDTSMLIIKIIWIRDYKLQFLDSIKHIDSLLDEKKFEGIYEKLDLSANEFLKFKNILIKSLIVKKENRDTLCSIIGKIYDLDVDIVKSVQDMFTLTAKC